MAESKADWMAYATALQTAEMSDCCTAGLKEWLTVESTAAYSGQSMAVSTADTKVTQKVERSAETTVASKAVPMAASMADQMAGSKDA
jgi:hypothetical protein